MSANNEQLMLLEHKISDLTDVLKKRREHSPDIGSVFENSKKELVFVYGTLKQGQGNNSVLGDSEYIGRGLTVRNDFTMSEVGFPIVFENNTDVSDAMKCHISGEVYAVDFYHMMALDRLESNGSMYQRKKVKIRLSDQNPSDPNPDVDNLRSWVKRDCWMYIGVDDYWGQKRRESIVPVYSNNRKIISWVPKYQRYGVH